MNFTTFLNFKINNSMCKKYCVYYDLKSIILTRAREIKKFNMMNVGISVKIKNVKNADFNNYLFNF